MTFTAADDVAGCATFTAADDVAGSVTFTAADDVACCATKLDVDDAVEDEVDGADRGATNLHRQKTR